MLRDDYITLDEACQQMQLTQAEVLDLVKRKALKAVRWAGWGQILIQPAVTNLNPTTKKAGKPRKAPAKTATAKKAKPVTTE